MNAERNTCRRAGQKGEIKQPYARATIYINTMFGWIRQEARDVSHSVGPYAQYRKGVHVVFTPKGARKPRGFSLGSDPAVVILQGWGHPDPDAREESNFFSMLGTKQQADFASCLERHFRDVSTVILADYRGHDPEDSIE